MNLRLYPRAFACSLLLVVSFMGCAEGNTPGPSASSSSSSSSSSGSGGAGGGSIEENIPEPDGPSKLTIVNGVNDYEAIRLCFVPWPDGGETPAFPADAKGLAFAAAAVIDVASGMVPKGTDVYLHVIAGNLDKTTGKGCAEITAGNLDPDVLLVPLAVIPKAALEAPRSLLLVPNGCLGGAGHEDELEKVACGKEYSIDTPTAGLVAVGMSRIVQGDKISMQAAHASVAMSTVDVRVLPGAQGGVAGQVAPGLTAGAIGKIPPFREFSRADLGPALATNIQTFPPGHSMPSSTQLLGEALGRGGIAEADFEDGLSFTLVGVGSAPGVLAGAFWHPLTWTVVRSDP
jgi:hypothetical protein